jgi:hypothetical protein
VTVVTVWYVLARQPVGVKVAFVMGSDDSVVSLTGIMMDDPNSRALAEAGSQHYAWTQHHTPICPANNAVHRGSGRLSETSKPCAFVASGFCVPEVSYMNNLAEWQTYMVEPTNDMLTRLLQRRWVEAFGRVPSRVIVGGESLLETVLEKAKGMRND